MRVETIEPTPNAMARAGLALIVATVLALAFLAPGRETPTLAQPIPTETATPAPTAIPPCPGNTIDRNGNGQDNGDCVSLTHASIGRVPLGYCNEVGGLVSRYGRISCRPEWTIGGTTQPLPFAALQVNPGCVRVERNPYPRLMIGLGSPTLAFSGLIPTNSDGVNPGGWMTGYTSGWYQTGLTGNAAIGLPSAGFFAAGNWSNQPFGSNYFGAPFPKTRLDIPAADFYPSVNNVSIRLVFVLDPSAAHPMRVQFAGMPSGIDAVDWSGAEPLQLSVNRSSNPAARIGSDVVVGSGGPDLSGPADLPAYQLSVQSSWSLYVQVYYEYWVIVGGNYVRDPSQPAEMYSEAVGALANRPSYRVWDAQQRVSAGLVGSPNCNALANEGYVPVPVIEGHSILIR